MWPQRLGPAATADKVADDVVADPSPDVEARLPPRPPSAQARDAHVKAEAAAAASRAFAKRPSGSFATSTPTPIAASAESGLLDPFALPYAVAKDKSRDGMGPHNYVVTFQAPPGWEDVLCRHPVSARGASFVLERRASSSSSSHGGSSSEVTCSLCSPEPEVTAAAIHARLVLRLKDPSPPGAEECTVM